LRGGGKCARIWKRIMLEKEGRCSEDPSFVTVSVWSRCG